MMVSPRGEGDCEHHFEHKPGTSGPRDRHTFFFQRGTANALQPRVTPPSILTDDVAEILTCPRGSAFHVSLGAFLPSA